ncbi:MAG: hypothetical protein Q8O57_01200, partial [Kiritimatiellota bacterium]|nr:hypothetical protein [Kiritimatiellota bacterium]
RNLWRLNIIKNGRKGDGETIMYETGSPGWYGRAKGAAKDTLTALDTDHWWPTPDKKGAWQTNEFAGGYCVIVEGRGLGQWAYIESNTADTLKLDRPWKLVPDGNSTFSVLREGSVENVHVGNDVLFTAGYSGNYRTSLRNIWAQNESEGHSDGLKFWNTSAPTYVTAFNVAFGERYHQRGGMEIINAMEFYQEKAYQRGQPGSVVEGNPDHQAWLAAFKNSRRVFGNEIRSCIVNERKAAWTQNGGLWTHAARMRLEKHGWRPDRMAGIALVTIMGWPSLPDSPADKVKALPKGSMVWNLVYDNLLSKCPVGISLTPASRDNFVLDNTFLECETPVLDMGENRVSGSVVVPEQAVE